MLSKEEWEDSFRNLPTRVLFNVILEDDKCKYKQNNLIYSSEFQ